ncbi:MAG: transketolase family protein [Acidimicrobiales bacterium]
MKATRAGYGHALIELGEHDDRVVVLTGDLADSTKVAKFRERFPQRFFELGVAEQNMMGVAAGLALSGKIPFVSSYATFSPGRNWDQLRVSVAYTEANVKVAGAHAGLSVGPDGATHQAMEDIAMVRALPNMVVVVPCDYEETKKATLAAASHEGPVYLRFARSETPVITTPHSPFEIGKAQQLRDGTDVTIVACGTVVVEALRAAELLAARGVQARVVNCHTVKPLDEDLILAAAHETGAIVTVEEHQITGGLGGAIAELLGERHPTPLSRVGMPDHFGESGAPHELMHRWGLTGEAIVDRAERLLARKTART